MIYVLKCDNPKDHRDQGAPTRVRLIGPFNNLRAAGNWGQNKHNNPDDNPCWQVVELDDPNIPLLTPEAA